MKPVKTVKQQPKNYVRFYYLRQTKDAYRYDRLGRVLQKVIRAGTPIALIGSTVDRGKGTIDFTLSIAHPDDNFCKKTAHGYIRANLKRRPFTIDLPKDGKGYEINCAIMKAILSDEENDRIVELLDACGARAPAKRGEQEQTIADWSYGRLRHQGLRALVSDWLAQSRWEDKPDLMQQVKDAMIKDPEVKHNPKRLFETLVAADYFNLEKAPNDDDKAVRFSALCKLLVEETQMKAVG